MSAAKDVAFPRGDARSGRDERPGATARAASVFSGAETEAGMFIRLCLDPRLQAW